MPKLNSREAIYGFIGWITSRKEVVLLGSSKDCAGLPELIEEFSEVNNLEAVSDKWPDNLIHPSGECSHSN